MLYVSTRGQSKPLTFLDSLLAGQASDGGLFMPEYIPRIDTHLDQWRELTFVELCQAVVKVFSSDLEHSTIDHLIRDAYTDFDCDEVVKLVLAGNRWILELFHGPTLAFKDIALQVLGNLFEHVLKGPNQYLNILGATSGDTGSAAIAGVAGRANMQIFVLYPNGRVSPMQELQMTSVADPNVHCLAIDGSFDDCQELMKEIFNDVKFKTNYRLGAVNSINWIRVMVQIVYYIYSSLRFDKPVTFSVPTGNFGNIFAGLVAKRMGAPIRNFILATNENDILARFFNDGSYKRGKVHQTTSPSMDIQVASNFERFVFLFCEEDTDQVTEFMAEFTSKGEAKLDLGTNEDGIFATRITKEAANRTIVDYWQKYDYLLEPHSAIGVAAADCFELDGPNICLATAHPAKFPNSINEAIAGLDIKHARLERLRNKVSRKVLLDANVQTVKDYIQSHALMGS